EVGGRLPIAARAAGGDVTAAEAGVDRRSRPPDERQGEAGRRLRPKAAVAVEQGRAEHAGAGRQLGDGGVGAGLLEAASAAAVDEAQDVAAGPDRGHDGGAAGEDLRLRAALEGPDGDALEPLTWQEVLQAGELGLVAHEAFEAEVR